jgi:hypothetical protein
VQGQRRKTQSEERYPFWKRDVLALVDWELHWHLVWVLIPLADGRWYEEGKKSFGAGVKDRVKRATYDCIVAQLV